MKSIFIPYDLSLELKKMGIDEPCFGFYQKEYIENIPVMVDDNDQYRLTGYRTCKNSEIPNNYISAPTFLQAFIWFENIHQLYPAIVIDQTSYPKYAFEIAQFIGNPKDLTEKEWYWEDMVLSKNLYRTRVEAEVACLEKLIEIVKEK